MRHLRYQCDVAYHSGEHRHPDVVMAELGLVCERTMPQTMGEQWWLFNCNDVPLPPFIVPMIVDAWMVNNYKLPKCYING